MSRFLLINNTQYDLPLKDSRQIPAQKVLAVEQITLEMRRLEKAKRITIKDQTTAVSTATDTNLAPLFVDVLPLASTVATVTGAGAGANPQTPAAGVSTYVYTKSVAEAVWDVNHNLGKFPSVVILDSSDDEVEGDVRYINSNRITITFSAAFAGRALLN
jgi:hypothetical protein